MATVAVKFSLGVISRWNRLFNHKNKKIMEVKELAAKKTLTKKEKEFLLSEATRLGIAFDESPTCSDCWQDLALQIYRAEKEVEPEQSENPEPEKQPKYRLKKGVNVRIVGTGELINEAVMTDDYAESLIKRGFTRYFEE